MINVDDRLIREDLSRIGVDAFAVLMCITSHLGKSSTAWPGHSRLRAMTGLSKDRTYKAITALIEAGMVERKQENDKGKWGRVVYRVTTNYIGIYMGASGFFLSEPLAGNPEYGYTEYAKPSDGNPAHISIKEGEVLTSKEVLTKGEERNAPAKDEETQTPKPPTQISPSDNFFAPDKHERAAEEVIRYLEENPAYRNGISGDWKKAVHGHCLGLQKKGRWNDLSIPKSEGQYYSWIGARIAGVKSWAQVAAELDKNAGRKPDATTIKAPVKKEPQPTRRRASADEARKIAGI